MSRAGNFPEKEKSTTRLADLSDHKNMIFQISLKISKIKNNNPKRLDKFLGFAGKKRQHLTEKGLETS